MSNETARQETLIEDTCSRLGLRVVHVMGVGAPVDVDRWSENLPGAAAESMRVMRRAEPKLGVHHLWLTWYAREAVQMRILDGQAWPAVLWWIRPGQSLREAAREAAEEHLTRYEEMADTAWVRTLPGGVEDGRVMDLGEMDGIPAKLTLRQADWMMVRFVVVGKKRD